MKNTARTFLKVQKILSIIFLIAVALAGLIVMIVGIATMVGGAVAGETEEAKAAAIAAGGSMVGGGIGMMFYIVFGILALVFGKIAKRALEESKTREEARKGAIFGIVAGALCGIFGIPAGIMMLVMKDEDYAEGAPAEEKPAEEQPEVIDQ